MASLGEKTPAQVYNDYLYLNNNNKGLLSNLIPIYAGNGISTLIKVSSSQVCINFGDSFATKPILDCYKVKLVDLGEKSGSLQISTLDGNVQKITLSGSVTISFMSNLQSSYCYEITLILKQKNGGSTITFGSGVSTPGASAISLSSFANATDVLKAITIDGGTSWMVYKVASDLR